MDPDGPETAVAGLVGTPDAGAALQGGQDRSAPAGGAARGGVRGAWGTDGGLAVLSATLPGFGTDRWIRLALQGAAISTTASVGVAMALFAFRRRRQDGDDDPDAPPPIDLTEAAAAVATPALAELVAAPAETESESHMPRWRRPSLMAARKATPGTDLAVLAAERLTFEHGSVEPDGSRERRRIKYRLVRLSDGPDEIGSAEIGRLDQGDEVELLERTGSYWRVRTPTGHEGWVHRMTVGEVVTAESAPPPVGGPAGLDPAAAAALRDATAEGPAPETFPESLAARFMGQDPGQ